MILGYLSLQGEETWRGGAKLWLYGFCVQAHAGRLGCRVMLRSSAVEC